MSIIFISRPVHDMLLEHRPNVIKEILAENPEPVWTLAGVSVSVSPPLYDLYASALHNLLNDILTENQQKDMCINYGANK